MPKNVIPVLVTGTHHAAIAGEFFSAARATGTFFETNTSGAMGPRAKREDDSGGNSAQHWTMLTRTRVPAGSPEGSWRESSKRAKQ